MMEFWHVKRLMKAPVSRTIDSCGKNHDERRSKTHYGNSRITKGGKEKLKTLSIST